MKVYLPSCGSSIPLFVGCPQSLPNLHTLEIGWADEFLVGTLKNALINIKLPMIKTLIIPPTAHPLLRHCHDVEDIVYVVGDSACHAARDKTKSRCYESEFLGSLASNKDSKIKRLAIPLVWWPNPSRKRFTCL